MINSEVFKNYGSEQWVIEQNLYFLLSEYWDACHEKYGNVDLKMSKMPINPVSFVKEFMNKETIVEAKWAEVSKMETLEKNEVIVEDAQVVEVDDNGERWVPIAPNIPEEMEQLREEAYGEKVDLWKTGD